MSDCPHKQIDSFVYEETDEPALVWACTYCKRRFYPACPKCIVVGHRGVEHPKDYITFGEKSSQILHLRSSQNDTVLIREECDDCHRTDGTHDLTMEH